MTLNTEVLEERNYWQVEFRGMGKSEDSSIEDRTLTVNAMNVTRPTLSIEEIPVPFIDPSLINGFPFIDYEGKKKEAYIAGRHQWKPITMDVEASEVVSRNVQEYFRNIQEYFKNLQYFPSNPPSQSEMYKFVTEINNPHSLEKWTLEGCCITQADWRELDSDGPASIRLKISYDHAKQDT